MLEITKLVERFGEEKARLFLQDYYSKPEHFWDFAALFSGLMGDAVPDFHRELVKELMVPGKFAGAAPRGGAKSTVVGLIFAAWLALNGKRWFIPYISDTFLQAKLLAGGLKAEIESNPKINFVYPNAVSKRWGEEGFVINGLQHECYILPLGAGMKIRGLKFKNHRPDHVIIDDLENMEVVYSKERRQKLQKWFDYDLEPAMDRYNKNITYIGTILHYHALLKQVLEKKGKYSGWRTRIWKAIDELGRSFWPARFPVEYLMAMRDDPNHPDYVGSIVFAQEMQNEPQDDQDRIIKIDWLREYNFREKWVGNVAETDEARMWMWLNKLEREAAVDTAISDEETSDFFAMYVGGFEQSTAFEYMLDLVHDHISDINKQVEVICDKVVEWKLTKLGIESVAFQKGLYTLVKKELNRRAIYTCQVVPIKTDKDKIRRARIHSSGFEAGHIYFRSDHQKCAILKDEILEFPLGAHDDAFDALMLYREQRQAKRARAIANNPLRR